MTDSKYDSPCHPDTKLYLDRWDMLVCACGMVYHNPDDQTVTDGKSRR